MCVDVYRYIFTHLPAVYEHLFFYMSVAFNHGSVGGAAKANRWAALRYKGPCRTEIQITFLVYFLTQLAF